MYIEDNLKIAAENNAVLNGTEIKDKVTNLNEINNQQTTYQEANNELQKKLARLKRLNIYALTALIIVLLFSVTTVVVRTKWNVKSYEVTLTANPIEVESVDSKTTNEILKESQEKGYTSNCMEFYFDGETGDLHRISNENNTYYDLESAKSKIYGYPITYSVSGIEETKRPNQSKTTVATAEFSFGLLDGSAQQAIPGTNNLVFSGYTHSLIDGYMQKVDPITVTNESVAIVINKRFEVTEDFINALMKNVVEDYYMLNSEEIVNVDTDYQSYFYGFVNEHDSIYYVGSHGVDLNGNKQQKLVKTDVMGIMEKNIENYLGKDISVTTKVPKISNEPITVIYLTTENFAYDYLYLINELELY